MSKWSLDSSFQFGADSISYRILGDGPPLVLVHGTPFSSYVWRRIARQLAPSFRIHLFDLLGYGESEKRAGQDVSLGVQNRLLTALLGHWRLDRPRVIAHDFGGATALRSHLLDGCDFDRLLLIDPVAIRPWGSPFVRHVHEHEAAFAGTPAYIHDALVAAYIRGAVRRSMSDAKLEPYLAPWRGPAGQPAFYRQIAQMDQRYTDEIEPRLVEIRCPVSILWGEQDRWIPPEQGRQLHALLPTSTLSVIPGAGHLVQEDAPEAIVAEALRFLAQ